MTETEKEFWYFITVGGIGPRAAALKHLPCRLDVSARAIEGMQTRLSSLLWPVIGKARKPRRLLPELKGKVRQIRRVRRTRSKMWKRLWVVHEEDNIKGEAVEVAVRQLGDRRQESEDMVAPCYKKARGD